MCRRQPPGDTLARPGVIDAVSVGCIPVLLHPWQLSLWPHHWNASRASIYFDWGRFRHQQARTECHAVVRGRAVSAPMRRGDHARCVLDLLLRVPPESIAALRREGARVARCLTYRGEHAGSGRGGADDDSDALDLTLQTLLIELGQQAAEHERERARRP